MNVGDAVHYTRVGKSKRTLSMTRVDGVLIDINDPYAVIKTRSGKKMVVELMRLRTADQPSQLTEFVEAVVAANKEEGGRGG